MGTLREKCPCFFGDIMNNEEILKIAMRQSAIESGCSAEDFCRGENKVVISKKNEAARIYLDLPFICDLTSYGNNIVASVSENLKDIVGEYINKYPVEHCFETPNLLVLMDKLRPLGLNVCYMAEYFLPDVNVLTHRECPYEMRLLSPQDFAGYYQPQWSNALCEKRRDSDVLAVGAYHNGKLIGLAGCSADCDSMWQIGVDVLPEYRRRGVACALTSELAIETLKRNIVPFYCRAWANVRSGRNAVKSGFKPAWVQLTLKTEEYIRNVNK